MSEPFCEKASPKTVPEKFILDATTKLPLNQIVGGDAFQVMRDFPERSVDLVVTDPPYGYSFMGKDWDRAVPSVEVWKECLRVLKSGAFAFVMSSPRQDVLSQMIVRLGEAGFDMGFSSVYWCYASGFPKSENISLQIDKRECFKQLSEKLGRKPTKEEFKEGWKQFREVVGIVKGMGKQNPEWNGTAQGRKENSFKPEYEQTKATSPEAKVLDGSYGGFQPKPAVEVIIVAMKPLSQKTYVDQALKNGKGVTWLDDARIPFTNQTDIAHASRPNFEGIERNNCDEKTGLPQNFEHGSINQKGRFPANLLVSDDVLNDGKVSNSREDHRSEPRNTGESGIYHSGWRREPNLLHDSGSFSRYFDLDRWFSKTVENLPESVRKTFPFLIVPKASKSERNQGLDNSEQEVFRAGHGNKEEDDVTKRFRTKMKNFHPTVKPLKLMSYLVTLGSRPNDVVLDPFVGSGTTCLAAEILNRKWIGIDNNPEYCEIARKRLAQVPEKLDTFLKIPGVRVFGRVEGANKT